MAKRIKKQKTNLKLEALETRQLLAGVTGSGTEVGPNISHPNGNTYDQVLLTGGSVTVTADAGQIVRVSFLDLNNDIVQAEFSGKGSLTVSMADGYTTGNQPTSYIQTVTGGYVQGLASFTITGEDATTNFNVFSVGKGNAVNQALFDTTRTGGNHLADIQRLTIVADPANPNGSTFGSIFAGNAVFGGTSGVVGISAANVQVQGVVRIGDIDASGTATPTLIFGTNSQFGSVDVQGGDFLQTNTKSLNNTGSYTYNLNFVAGADSTVAVGGAANLPAQQPASGLSFTGNNPISAQTKTFTLTTGVDTVVGTAGNDVINGSIDTTNNTGTLTVLDSLNGGAGNDTLNIADLDGNSGLPAGVTISNIESIRYASAGVAKIDTTTVSGLTSLEVTAGTSSDIDAAKTTAITVSGITGANVVDGGSSVMLTTAGTGITIGGTAVPVGAIDVTHTAQGANAIAINGGTTVKVTASGVSTGTVNIGAATSATGAVTVSSTGAAYTASTGDTTLGAITVKGGTNISVTQSASSDKSAAATDVSKATITESAISITGDNSTTTVSVTQDAAVDPKNAVVAVSSTRETDVLTFLDLPSGKTTTVNGLTFTASKALTAAQVAAAFSNLTSGTTQGSAPASNGIYSGTFTSGWTTGAVSSDKVTVTATTGGNKTDIVLAGDVVPTDVHTDGTGSTTGVTGVMGIIAGKVTIADGNTGTDSITSVTLSGYGAGSKVTSDSLNTLSLANTTNDLTIVGGTATTLALTVNGVGTGSNHAIVDDSVPKYTTINITATGASSTIDLDATVAKTITLNGSKTVNLTGATLDALETITVTESAGLNIDGDQADTLTAITASGTSGSITATINPTKATYAGSSGADTVTFVTGTNPDKTIDLGAGNDTLTLAAGTTATTSNLVGGDGTDTLSMAAADANTASSTTAFGAKIVGFEKLKLGQVAAAATPAINLDNMAAISYVVTGGLAASNSSLTIDKMANNGTLEITAAGNGGTTNVNLKDATGTSDSLNVVVSNSGNVDAGVVNVPDVESITLTATDTDTNGIDTATVALKANKLTTLTLNGNAAVSLTLDAATSAVTLINGSALSAKLTVTGNTTVAQEIRGGSGGDQLTAGHQSDVLLGNGGNDTLIANGKSLVTLTGGTGTDTFDISVATTNVNSYATVTDLEAGDKIKFAGTAANFVAAAITLDPSTAVFQDYANAAIASSNAGDVLWFQYNGNTYIVQNVNDGASFLNSTDIIVKISGTKDLSTASFTSSSDTLLIV